MGWRIVGRVGGVWKVEGEGLVEGLEEGFVGGLEGGSERGSVGHRVGGRVEEGLVGKIVTCRPKFTN